MFLPLRVPCMLTPPLPSSGAAASCPGPIRSEDQLYVKSHRMDASNGMETHMHTLVLVLVLVLPLPELATWPLSRG